MCGCDNCCTCIPNSARENIKYVCICFGVLYVAVALAVLLVAYGFLRHASLTSFALVTSQATALAYNLTLTLAVRNRNWAMSMKNTKPLEAAYKFDRVQVAGKGDKHPAGNTVVYRLATSSESDYVALGNAGCRSASNVYL